jgi:tetratricopeptide (TPR) repeat protein
LGAHDSSPAGPEREALVQRAIDSLVTAAERSASLHADRAALDLYDRAIELAPPGVQVAEWCIAASRCATACSGRDQALAYLDRAEDLMRGSDGGDMPARIALARGFVYNTMFESGEALRVIEPVYLALDDVDDELSLAIAAEAARAYSLSVRIPEAVAAADRALPVAERLDEVVHAVELLITRGTTLSFSGRAIEGTANLVGAYEIATQQGLLDQAVRAANNIAALMRDAHWPSVHEWVQRLDEMCARLGVPEWSLRVRFYEVIESMFDGRCNDAIAALEEWSETEPDEVWARLVDWFSAAAAARLGRPGAIELLLDKLEYLRSTTDPQSANLLHFHDAVVASWRSDWQGALDASRRAIGDSHVAMVMFHAAARLGLTPSSLDALRADHFPAITGPMRTAHRALFDAAQRVIDGDTSAAAHALDRAIALLEGAAVAEDVMWARAAAIALLGAGHPQAERHASWIRAWIRDHELWGFVPMLDGVVDIAVDGDVRVAG